MVISYKSLEQDVISMIAPKLYLFHSLFWAYDTVFDLHILLQECSWGIKQGLGIITCNTEDLIVIVCVFLEVFLTALYFRVTYWPHLQSLYSIQACALCSCVPSEGNWEHKALA
jgi:hypothetical protein